MKLVENHLLFVSKNWIKGKTIFINVANLIAFFKLSQFHFDQPSGVFEDRYNFASKFVEKWN